MEAENSKGALTHLVTTRKPQKLRPTVLVLVTDQRSCDRLILAGRQLADTLGCVLQVQNIAQFGNNPDPEAIEHLDDVFGVLATAEPVVLGVFIAAVLTAVGVGCASGRRTFGTVLLCAGLGTIAAFGILGIWAAIDFEGLFAVFHSLFFAQGSWVFSADSLLITMYPEPFWIGMGATWLATTIAVSAISAIAGLALRRA